jgi:O-antigen/teichoic acid export membrane protein
MLSARYILSTTGSTVVGGGLQLALTVVAARLLTPEQNGHYAQFILIFNLAFIGLNFGLGPASTFFVASGRASVRDVRRVNGAVLIGLTLLLGLFPVLHIGRDSSRSSSRHSRSP